MQKKDVDFKKLPDTPGVYIFKNARGTILYVGKATSLRSRVRSYFSKDISDTRGPKIVKMLDDAATVETQRTESVLEALILEANLIKKHQPEGNTNEKDNKSFNYLVITKEDFPRVLTVRGRELFADWKDKDIKYMFGPFPKGGALKEALKIVRKIFPYRDTCEPFEKGRPTRTLTGPNGRGNARRAEKHDAGPVSVRACFNKQIGLCPGVCDGSISKTAYAEHIRYIKLLFEGKKQSLLKDLEKEMKQLAKAEKFEDANDVKQQVFALKHIRETALLGDEYRVSAGDDLGRIEAYDVAHISETARVGVMVVVEEGKPAKNAYRKFNIKTEKQGDIAALEEILRRRFDHNEWALPKIMVIDGGVAQKNAAQKVLDEYGYKIPIINVVKNDKHKAGKVVGNAALIAKAEKDVILANAEAHRFAIAFHRKKRSKGLTG